MTTHLKAGDSAPEFSAPSSDGTAVALKDFREKQNVALFFYVKDSTPG